MGGCRFAARARAARDIRASAREGREAITTNELADVVIHALAEERFIASTDLLVLEKLAVKPGDYD